MPSDFLFRSATPVSDTGLPIPKIAGIRFQPASLRQHRHTPSVRTYSTPLAIPVPTQTYHVAYVREYSRASTIPVPTQNHLIASVRTYSGPSAIPIPTQTTPKASVRTYPQSQSIPVPTQNRIPCRYGNTRIPPLSSYRRKPTTLRTHRNTHTPPLSSYRRKSTQASTGDAKFIQSEE